MGIKNVFKWRVTTNKYLYLTDEENQAPFILDKRTGDRTYPQPISGSTVTGITVVTGMTLDEGLISQTVSKIKSADSYSEKYDKMVELVPFDNDASKLTFLEYEKYFNLDGDECVEEAVTPKCEGYEPMFNVSAYTLPNSGETEVEYTFYAERNEADKTLRYNLELGIPRGEKGEKGDDGIGCKGDKGDDGLPAIIENVEADITAIDPDEEASVEVVSSKTGDNEYELNFNFRIPRGEQGEEGPVGDDGPAGWHAIVKNVTATASALMPGSTPTVDVTNFHINQNALDKINETSFRIDFGLPTGLQGVQGNDGRNAEIREVTASVETLEPGYWYPSENDPNRTWIRNDAEVGVDITPSGGGNVVDLHFWFKIPRGEKGDPGGTSGGTDGWQYDFKPVDFIPWNTQEPMGYFYVDYHPLTGEADVTLTIYYPQDWGGGGAACDDDCRKHRYDYYQNNSDSLSEGMVEVINGTVYPLAIAQGTRSHAEGIGMYASTETFPAEIKDYDSDTIDGFYITTNNGHHTPSYITPQMFDGATVVIDGVDYTLHVDDRSPDDDEDAHFTYDTFTITDNLGSIVFEMENGEIITDNLSVHDNFTVMVNYTQPNAIGIATHTEGNGCQTNGDYSHAEGNETRAFGVGSHAEGAYTKANGDYSHACGFATIAEGIASHAEGYAESGCTIQASGDGAQACGCAYSGGTIEATNDGSHAEGYAESGCTIQASGDGAHAGGYANSGGTIQAISNGSHACGYAYTDSTIEASGEGSQACGCANSGGTIQATNNGSHACGCVYSGSTIEATSDGSQACGYANSGGTIEASSNGSHAEGYAYSGSTIEASNSGSHAEGYADSGCTIQASGEGSHACGYAYNGGTIEASGGGSHAEGYADSGCIIQASGEGSQACGCAYSGGTIEATNDGSHAEGCNTKASGFASHAEGIGYPGESHNVICVLSSFGMCDGTSEPSTTNIVIHEKFEKEEIYIIGSKFEYNGTIYTVTSAESSYRPENTNTAFTNVMVEDEDGNEINISYLLGGRDIRLDNSIVLSGVTMDEQENAIGAASHTENNLTVAEGDYSHAEGNETRAFGVGSHTEGCFTEANGDYSHAAGLGTIANNDCMTVIGKFNNSGTTSGDLFVIGNGTDNENRSNVLSVNGSTKKITLASDGGIQLQSGGSSTLVWNTTGGTTEISGGTGGGRAIQVNGSQILSSDSTTPLNLSGGTGISISGATGGTVTITSTVVNTDTTYKLTLNGTQKGSGTTDLGTFYAPISGGTSGQYLKSNGNGAPTWDTFPTIPSAPGTLTTTATTSQTTAIGESLSGTINLHKISKTGDYSDLLNKPTIPVNTDYQVQQSSSTTNDEYCLLAKATTGATSVTGTTIYDSSVTINPSTHTITGIDEIKKSNYRIKHGDSNNQFNTYANLALPHQSWDYDVLVLETSDGSYMPESAGIIISKSEGIQIFAPGDGYGDYIFSTYDEDDLDQSGVTPIFGVTNTKEIQCNGDLQVTGNTYCTGAYYASGTYSSSDIRKKDVLEEISLDKAYELVEKCQTIFYTWKDDETKKKEIGLIAQEVQQYFPELISEDKDGYLTLDYSKLTVILLVVIRDLTQKVSKIDMLEEKIKQLENKIQ